MWQVLLKRGVCCYLKVYHKGVVSVKVKGKLLRSMPIRKQEGAELLESIRRGLAQATRKKEASGAKTLQQIASEVGVDVNTLRRYMDGRFRSIPVDVAVRWAGAVGVSISTWREEFRERDPFSQILRLLEQLPAETADRVAVAMERRLRTKSGSRRKRNS